MSIKITVPIDNVFPDSLPAAIMRSPIGRNVKKVAGGTLVQIGLDDILDSYDIRGKVRKDTVTLIETVINGLYAFGGVKTYHLPDDQVPTPKIHAILAKVLDYLMIPDINVYDLLEIQQEDHPTEATVELSKERLPYKQYQEERYMRSQLYGAKVKPKLKPLESPYRPIPRMLYNDLLHYYGEDD